MKHSPLRRHKGLRPISPKRLERMKEEAKIIKELCEKAGGRFFPTAWSGGEVIQGICVGGVCQVCGQRPDWRGLSPHEKVFRSRGGKVSKENTIMVCGDCHAKYHGTGGQHGDRNET